MKRLAVLQVTPANPTKEHVDFFSNKEECDFYFVTHDKENPDALKFCPETTWVDTRNILADLVPKKYEYYAFVDYDYRLESLTTNSPLEQILDDLKQLEPAVLTYYPGTGLITPYATDLDYRGSRDYSIIPFTHCGLKIVHHSLMPWFFPMVTRFGGGVEACHFFNIQELPFLNNVVCSHKMIYHNKSETEVSHNQNGFMSKLNMDKMWAWIRPYFTKRYIIDDSLVGKVWGDSIPPKIEEYVTSNDSLSIKNVFQQLFRTKLPTPSKSTPGVNYFSEERIKKFFDIEHEHLRAKFGKPAKDMSTVVVVGNGPSLKQEYLDYIVSNGVDSFGLNSAYRYFDPNGWCPTYFGCFDYALTESHKEEWSKMLLDPQIPIEKWFLIERPSIEALADHTQRYFSEQVRRHTKYVERPHNQDGIGHPEFGTRGKKISCTGANAVRTAFELGYHNVILVGHDATYVQSADLEEASLVQGCRFEIKEEMSTNPNYFWQDYQRKGDLFHNPGDVLPIWRRLGILSAKYWSERKVVNCAARSRIDCFPKEGFFDVMKRVYEK